MLPLLRFQQVSYRYPHQEKWAVQRLSFSITSGEFVGILGADGAGKTT
ncbi:ABC transporter ATP-binding protein, partial [candidate division KSB3 bacterium]|nr:ABC transporter ATP-binding protein [candidate division KSB3 bacterium]